MVIPQAAIIAALSLLLSLAPAVGIAICCDWRAKPRQRLGVFALSFITLFTANLEILHILSILA